jgi:hypothetical protein
MLKSGGLNLHKWCLNSPQLLNQLAGQHHVQLADHQAVKTLGLSWLPKSDYFLISTANELPQNQPFTKRTVLSSIASLYDPLGLASPIVVTAKLLMQNLWRKQIEWDQVLHEVDHNNWIHFRAKLNELQEIKVARCIISKSKIKSNKLLGLCDASSVAHGACVYVRCTDHFNKSTTNLLCVKSRVAPLKATTIPRLELCSSLLLAQLITKVDNAMQMKFDKMVRGLIQR